MIRKSGIGTLLGIAVVMALLFYLLTDAWLESKLEEAGSSAVGAKVEFDGFDFSLFGPHISWQRLQVTDPAHTMKNMIETGFCEFDMEFWPLLSRKVIINNCELSGIKTNTDRKTDGAIPKKEKITPSDDFFAPTIDRLNKQVKETPALNLASLGKKINVDSLVSILNLKTPQLADSLRNALQNSFDEWNKRVTTINPEADTKRIERQIKSIDIKKINSPETFNTALNNVQKVKTSIDSLNTSFKKTKTDLATDLSQSKNALGQVDDWVKADYSRAMDLAKLPDFSTENIAKILFGENVVGRVQQYMGYVATARKYASKLQSKEKKEPGPPRLKGQDIYYPSKNARPDFWLKRVALSGEINVDLPLSGEVTDITSQPKFIGKPVLIDIKGGDQKINFTFGGMLDYLQEQPKENFSATYNNFSINGFKLGRAQYMPKSISKGKGNLNAELNFSGDTFKGEIKFLASAVDFDFGDQKANGKVEKVVRDVFNQTKNVSFTTRLSGNKADLKFTISSDLGRKLSDALKSTVSKEVEDAKNKLRAKIDQKVAAKKAELNKFVETNRKKIEDEIARYQAMIDKQKDQLEQKKKEIEDQKNKLGDKVKNKLKNLLKP